MSADAENQPVNESPPAVELTDAARRGLLRQLQAGLTLPQSVRLMRQTAKLNIKEMAQVAGVSFRYQGDIERGLMNPTVSILDRIGRPFGLRLQFGPIAEPVAPTETHESAPVATKPGKPRKLKNGPGAQP
jgi:transcriptional regulator with XRE-family HTH domain